MIHRQQLSMLIALGVGPSSLPGASIVPPGETISNREAELALIDNLVASQSLESAIDELRALLAIEPGNIDLSIRLAQLQVWRNQAGPAADRLEQLEAQAPLPRAGVDVLAEAYLQLKRYGDAALLHESRLHQPPEAEDLPDLLGAAKAYTFAGAHNRALDHYQTALTVAPHSFEAQRGEALALAWTGQAEAALPRLRVLAERYPEDSEIAHALASFTPSEEQAGALYAEAQKRAELEPNNPDALLALADLEVARGHAATARSLYLRAATLISDAQKDAYAERRALAGLSWGDFYTIEAHLREQLEAHPDDTEIHAQWVGMLLAMDRFNLAEAAARRWVAEAPRSSEAQSTLAAVRLRKDPNNRESIYAELPHAEKPAPPIADPVADDFFALEPDIRTSEDYLLSLTRGADAYQKSGTILPDELEIPLSASQLEHYAGLYASEGDFETAIRCLRAARLADPEYFPAHLMLAEFLAIAGHYEESWETFQPLAMDFPESRQIRLKQARALAWGRRYEDALEHYATLAAEHPEDAVLLLEEARVAGWAKERKRSAELYARTWIMPVDRMLAEGILEILPSASVSSPALPFTWRQWAEEYLEANPEPLVDPDPEAPEPFTRTQRFANQLPLLTAEVSAENAVALRELHRSLLDEFFLQRAFWLENRAKQLAWEGRHPRAEDTYRRLLAVEPNNQEALFDYSQTLAAQGLGQKERAALKALLQLDSNNRLAARASFRRQRRSEPILSADLDFFRELGRGQLSSITRLRAALTLEDTFYDQYRLHARLLRWREDPDTMQADWAYGYAIGGNAVFNRRLSASAEYTHKRRDYSPIGNRLTDTGFLQGWFRADGGIDVGIGFERREELANQWALLDGTTSDHHWVGVHYQIDRKAALDAKYDLIEYSDSNDGYHFNLSPSYIWSDHPRTFKTILSLDWRDTDEDNRYLYSGTQLTSIEHPYWAPQGYFGAALILEWRHDLASEFFLGAPEHWYDLRVILSLGNDGNSGVSFAGDYAVEWIDRWILRAGFEATLSEDWDALRLHLSLSYRF